MVTNNVLQYRAVTFLMVAATFIPHVVASEPAPKRGESHFEIDFMEDMIDHHQMAVMMAMMCEDKAVHEELHDLCQQIQESQSAQITEMQTWLRDWYGISHEPQMSRKMQRQMAELTGASGADFEIMFLEMMMEHHAVAVKEGRKCEKKSYHEELHELCQNIVMTQSMEIETMGDWLCDWYDICE